MAMHRGIETPAAMAGRPVDPRLKIPVPWFVTEKDERGHWDFALIRPERFDEARRRHVCWVSGTPLGKHMSFAIGPMCLVNRISADPPVRREIALWSVRICPFMSQPGAWRDRRLQGSIDEDGIMVGQRGNALAHNPGIAMVYTTDKVAYWPSEHLYVLGDPTEVSFWREGREATPDEIWDAFDRGVTRLMQEACKEGQGAVAEATHRLDKAVEYLPARPVGA